MAICDKNMCVFIYVQIVTEERNNTSNTNYSSIVTRRGKDLILEFDSLYMFDTAK